MEQDANRIATYIRSEVDAKRRKFSDFLILTRKKHKRIVPYARALEALNIPIEVSGAGAFGQSEEVEALTVLLRALSDPQDPLALVAVLRGPLFGISDPELFAYKQCGGWFSIFASGDEATSADDSKPDSSPAASGGLAAASGGFPSTSGGLRLQAEDSDLVTGSRPAVRVTAALTALRQYYRWTRLLPAAAALDRILDHTGYLALAATTPGGVEAGDVLHAVDRVRQVVEEGSSLAGAADALEADSEERNEVESLPLEPGRTDVVRVMNLHKAKGLEANVVLLADPTGGFAPRVDVHIERRDLKAQGWFQVIRKSEDSFATTLLGQDADWEAHKAAELPYLEAEQDRLLYVAATRARELLVVSRFTGNQKSPAWGVLNDFLASAKELPIPTSATAPSVKALDCSTKAQTDSDGARLAAHEQVEAPSWSVTSVTAEAHHIARMTRAADATADDPTKVVSPGTPSHRADAGMAWGTLIHGLLEHAMRHKSATREDLRRLAMWMTVEEPRLRTVIDEALDTVERVGSADFWQVARDHSRSVESPFFVSESGRLTNGVIDLMFQGDGGWQVIDYKTDVALANKYADQLNAYRAALRKVGCEVADASVVSVRAQK